MCGGFFSLFVHFLFSFGLACIIFFLSYILVLRIADIEKLSAYECGFSPFETTHTNFEVRYFLVALLFILFDLEVSFLFPWVMLGIYNDFFSYTIGIIYLYILTLGFVYEWRRGALDFC